MNSSSSVSAVIVTHNNAATIEQCLTSLQSQNLSQIVIVDNASTDRTVSLLAAHTIIKNSINQGFAAAVNQGVAQTATDFIFLCNPDAVVGHDITPAITYMASAPACAITGLGLVDEQGQLEPWSFSRQRVTPLSLISRKLTPSLLPRPVPPHLPVAWTSAGAMIIRRSAFDAVGGFDPHFFLYWEDVDFCRRLEKAGFQIEVFPRLTVRHRRGQSLTDNHRKAQIYDDSADRYFQKHYPAYIWWPLRHIRRFYRWLQPASR